MTEQEYNNHCIETMKGQAQQFYDAAKTLATPERDQSLAQALNASLNVLTLLVAQLIELVEEAQPGTGTSDRALELFFATVKAERPRVRQVLDMVRRRVVREGRYDA